MSKTALIVGANGRFGRAAERGLRAQGWQTVLFTRQKSDHYSPHDKWQHGDARDADAVTRAAIGCDVIVNALTPPYSQWSTQIPQFTSAIIAAAQTSGAHILVPGNIYNYGRTMPPVLREDTPHRATTTLGRARIEMENQYRSAAAGGVKTLILRAGDFFEREVTGNWFDSHITSKIAQGRIVYPGTMGSRHCWAYLPDLGRAVGQCCEALDRFETYDTIGFPGYALTGREFIDLLEQASGKTLKVAGVPWPLVRLLSLFKPDLRGAMEVAYQWRTPHQIDGGRFAQMFPDFVPTPKLDAFKEAISDRISIDDLAPAPLSALEVGHGQ